MNTENNINPDNKLKREILDSISEAFAAINEKTSYYTEITQKYKYEAHLHPYPRILIMLEGKSEIKLCHNETRVSITANKGDSFFIPKEGWLPWPRPLSKYIRGLGINFMPEYIRIVEWDATIENPKPLHCIRWYHTSFPMPKPISSSMKIFPMVSDSESFSYSAPYLTKFILCQLVHYIKEDKAPIRARKSKQVWLEIQSYLSENFVHENTRDEIAKVFNIHPNHVSRIIQKEAGISFFEYLSELRINRAKELLSYGKKLTVSEIAYKSGFSSSSYFCKSFKKATGITLLQYYDKIKKAGICTDL